MSSHKPQFGLDTIATHAGRNPAAHAGSVNPPVYHASTILFDRMEDYENRRDRFYDGVGYGLYNTPTTLALAEAVAELEDASHCLPVQSGTAAIATTLMAFASSGAHLLVVETAYRTTRNFCEEILRPLGIDITYYDPMLGAAIADLITPATTLVYLESPGSMTFEVQDIPAITEVARRYGVPTAIDASWASPVFLRPLALGVDISIQSGTKYLCGHSDIIFGTVAVRDETLFRRLKDISGRFGHRLGGEDCYMALRGLRTLPLRMQRHQETALRLAEWLAARPEVKQVLHPAFPQHPGHSAWRRDFTGASGLFGVLLHPVPRSAVAAALEGMKLFKMGSSWGGYESLIVPVEAGSKRASGPGQDDGALLRVHAGLETADDLIADLREALVRLVAHAPELAKGGHPPSRAAR
ncbi:cystathionine beta-lyase [Mesorhizobium comanense]|jgi:cystathionine beta-lyase|uniref:cystathionine beta-lyase n=1 Tax=Mesorhizobium comanense TaxID=2502215 RepID=UPI0010FA23D3|nr:cystathionine beta-lyase [Mesorhizobium comanense]